MMTEFITSMTTQFAYKKKIDNIYLFKTFFFFFLCRYHNNFPNKQGRNHKVVVKLRWSKYEI